MGAGANLIVGLTGGMGCGKSTAAALFAGHGFRKLDADQTVRDELLTDPEIVAIIRAKLGPETILPDGKVNRRRVAELVFANDVLLRWLEDLLHPRLFAGWRAIFAASEDDKFIVEVPLLFEKGMENWFDFIVCVTSDQKTQIRRLELRGLPPELARLRLTKQLPLERKCELADFVILNDGSFEFLREQVDRLAGRILHAKTA
jgi:dephospho-CoA kinase